MKKATRAAALLLAVCAMIFCTACGDGGIKLDIKSPVNPASIDEVDPDYEDAAIQPSTNVNGMRFNLTPYEFTVRYNTIKRVLGENDLIMSGNWRVNGKSTVDNNGVSIQYLYYDDKNVNFTATVETDTGKLVNIGIGTTTSHFMTQNDDDENNSDKVLRKAAMMAQAACRFEDDSLDLLQNIFYRTTTEANNALWFKGFMFTLSTRQNKEDSKNNILLFRVFPISDELKNEWKPVEYEAGSR